MLSSAATSTAKVPGIPSFAGDPTKWPAYLKAMRSYHGSKTYTRGDLQENGQIRDVPARAVDFYLSREACQPEVLPLPPLAPPAPITKAAREQYAHDSSVWALEEKRAKHRNQTLTEAHEWAINTLLSNMEEEPATLARTWIANRPQSEDPVTLFELVESRSQYYHTSNPLLDRTKMLEDGLAPMSGSGHTTFRAYAVAAVGFFKDWDKSFFQNNQFPDGYDAEERAAGLLVAWLEREWYHPPDDAFPLPSRYHEPFERAMSDQSYASLETFQSKRTFLENAMTMAEAAGDHYSQSERSVVSKANQNGGKPTVIIPRGGQPLSKNKIRALLGKAGAPKSQVKKVLKGASSEDPDGDGQQGGRRKRSRTIDSAAVTQHSERHKCSCDTTCTCEDIWDDDDGDDGDLAAEIQKGMIALQNAPKSGKGRSYAPDSQPSKRGTRRALR